MNYQSNFGFDNYKLNDSPLSKMNQTDNSSFYKNYMLNESPSSNYISEENENETSPHPPSQTPNLDKSSSNTTEDDYDIYSDWNLQFQQINNLEDEDKKSSAISSITSNFHFNARVLFFYNFLVNINYNFYLRNMVR